MTVSIKSFGVIGSGVMGRGIVELAASRGNFETVLMCDVSREQLDSAMKGIDRSLGNLVKKGKLEEARKAEIYGKIKPVQSLEDLGQCQFIVEAVTEKFETKRDIFTKLSNVVGNKAWLASNTSSLPITLLGSLTKNPDRVIGMHFMNPVPIMKGLEIISGLYTSPETVKLTIDLGLKFGKEITFSKDRAGFVINRILMPMLNDAINGVNLGIADIKSIDQYYTEPGKGPSHRMGPLELTDLIGLDTTLNIMKVLAGEFGSAYAPDPLLVKLVDKGAMGAKNGKGFYLWENWKKQDLNPLVADLQQTKTAAPSVEAGAKIGKRSWLRMMNEAAHVVEEGTSSIQDIEKGCLFCLNHSEGILAALDKLGVPEVFESLKGYAERYGSDYLATPLLKRMLEAGMTGKAGTMGFMKYSPDGKSEGVNPALERYLKNG